MILSLVNARIQVQEYKYYSYRKQTLSDMAIWHIVPFHTTFSMSSVEPQAKSSLSSRLQGEVINILHILYL